MDLDTLQESRWTRTKVVMVLVTTMVARVIMGVTLIIHAKM